MKKRDAKLRLLFSWVMPQYRSFIIYPGNASQRFPLSFPLSKLLCFAILWFLVWPYYHRGFCFPKNPGRVEMDHSKYFFLGYHWSQYCTLRGTELYGALSSTNQYLRDLQNQIILENETIQIQSLENVVHFAQPRG